MIKNRVTSRYKNVGTIAYETKNHRGESTLLFDSKTNTDQMYFHQVFTSIKIDLNDEGEVYHKDRGSEVQYGLENGEITRRQIRDDVRRSQSVNTVMGDLNSGTVDMIFNFTREPITVFRRSGERKVYAPLDSDLRKHYENEILFLRLHYHNNPLRIRDMCGVDYYPEKILEELEANGGTGLCRGGYVETLRYLVSKKDAILNNESIKYINTLQTVSALSVGPGYTCSQMIDEGVYLEVDDLIIKSGCMGAIPKFPLDTVERISAESLLQSMQAGSMQVLIQDPSNEISQRYINCAGMAVEIERTTMMDAEPGLYVLANGEIQLYLTMAQIKTNKYIFASKEEAIKGGDFATLSSHSRELEINELEYRNKIASQEALLAKAKTEREKHESEIRKLKEESELERIRYQQKLSEYQAKQDHYSRQVGLLAEQDRVSSRKYDRDVHLDALKTTGGIIVSGIALYLAIGKLNRG